MISEILQKEVERIIATNDVALARLKWQELGNQNNIDVNDAIVPLKLLSLPLLKKEEVLALFDSDFSRFPFALTIDIPDKLRRRLSLMPREERNAFITILSEQADPKNLLYLEQALTIRKKPEQELILKDGVDEDSGAATGGLASESMGLEKKQLTPVVDGKTRQNIQQKQMLQQTREYGTTFDQNDALEVDWHRSRMNADNQGMDYARIADDIIRNLGLVWDDPLMKKRFISVITSRLKDIRSEIETRDLLMKAKKIGGLEIAPEMAHSVVSALRPMVFQQLPDSGDKTLSVSTIGAPSALRLAQDAPIRPRPPQPPAVIGLEQAPLDTHLQDATQRPQPVRLFVPTASPPLQKATTKQPVVQGYKIPVQQVKESAEATVPQVTDVKLPPNMTRRMPLSLSQSIGSLTITEVRNAPLGIVDILDMVKSEIMSATEESFMKKMELIKAWRNSPLHTMYVSIGSRSMESGLPVSEVLKNMGTPDQMLTREEFDKILEFNREIGG